MVENLLIKSNHHTGRIRDYVKRDYCEVSRRFLLFCDRC